MNILCSFILIGNLYYYSRQTNHTVTASLGFLIKCQANILTFYTMHITGLMAKTAELSIWLTLMHLIELREEEVITCRGCMLLIDPFLKSIHTVHVCILHYSWVNCKVFSCHLTELGSIIMSCEQILFLVFFYNFHPKIYCQVSN